MSQGLLCAHLYTWATPRNTNNSTAKKKQLLTTVSNLHWHSPKWTNHNKSFGRQWSNAIEAPSHKCYPPPTLFHVVDLTEHLRGELQSGCPHIIHKPILSQPNKRSQIQRLGRGDHFTIPISSDPPSSEIGQISGSTVITSQCHQPAISIYKTQPPLTKSSLAKNKGTLQQDPASCPQHPTPRASECRSGSTLPCSCSDSSLPILITVLGVSQWGWLLQRAPHPAALGEAWPLSLLPVLRPRLGLRDLHQSLARWLREQQAGRLAVPRRLSLTTAFRICASPKAAAWGACAGYPCV